MLYQAYQLQSDLTSPWRLMAQHLSSSLWLQDTERSVLRKMSAACDVLSRMRLTHTRPAYGIDRVQSAGQTWGIEEETVLSLPFGSLLHFKKVGDATAPQQPPVLLAAPLSGHFATLLRETVRTLLQDHDVYITDWHNARDVGLWHGGFGLDDYIGYLMAFLQTIGPGAHMVAVCQPCVAALAATHADRKAIAAMRAGLAQMRRRCAVVELEVVLEHVQEVFLQAHHQRVHPGVEEDIGAFEAHLGCIPRRKVLHVHGSGNHGTGNAQSLGDVPLHLRA